MGAVRSVRRRCTGWQSLLSLLQSMAMGGAISGGVLAIAGTLLTAIGATIFIITWPLLAAFLSADSYRQWIHDALQGTPQVSLKELLCRGFLLRHLCNQYAMLKHSIRL